MTTNARCELCGEPMPLGEEMFKFHGYSGPCPQPVQMSPVVESVTIPLAMAVKSDMPEPHEEARGHYRVVLMVAGVIVPTDIVGTSPQVAVEIFAERLVDHRVGDWPLKR